MLTKVLRSVEGCARPRESDIRVLLWSGPAHRPHALLNVISRESRLKLKHHFKRTFQVVASPHRRAPAMFAIIAGRNETPLLQRSYIIQIYAKKKKTKEPRARPNGILKRIPQPEMKRGRDAGEIAPNPGSSLRLI